MRSKTITYSIIASNASFLKMKRHDSIQHVRASMKLPVASIYTYLPSC